MDPKPQDDESVELDDELVIDEDDGEPDEDELLKKYGL